jgi:hypothetical protein
MDETRNEHSLLEFNGYDTFFYHKSVRTYITRLSSMYPNHSREYKIIKPDTNIEFGKTITFKIKRNMDAIEELYIKFKLPDLFSQTVMTNIREGIITYSDIEDRYEYLDGIGYYLFNSIDIRVNGKLLYNISPEILQIYHRELSLHKNDCNIIYRAENHGYFGGDDIYNQYETTKMREYCVKLPLGGHILPIGMLKNEDVEIVFNIKHLDEILMRPKQREKTCDMREPYNRSVLFENQSTGGTVSYNTKMKKDMLLEGFELVASCLYFDIPLRVIYMKSDYRPEMIYYQQFEEEYDVPSNGSIMMNINPTGIARNLYVFIRLKENEDHKQYTNFSNETTSILSVKEPRKCIQNISLILNRNKVFEAKQSDLLEIQEVEHNMMSNISNYKSGFERVLVIPLLNMEMNIKGSIIWERFDDIMLNINTSFLCETGTRNVVVYVISENSTRARYYSKQADREFI